ncbi:MAG: restriction endonuclease [Chloroflexi bacterium]|nr:restriction endonuclease [Chloroflexota bacterium]
MSRWWAAVALKHCAHCGKRIWPFGSSFEKKDGTVYCSILHAVTTEGELRMEEYRTHLSEREGVEALQAQAELQPTDMALLRRLGSARQDLALRYRTRGHSSEAGRQEMLAYRASFGALQSEVAEALQTIASEPWNVTGCLQLSRLRNEYGSLLLQARRQGFGIVPEEEILQVIAGAKEVAHRAHALPTSDPLTKGLAQAQLAAAEGLVQQLRRRYRPSEREQYHLHEAERWLRLHLRLSPESHEAWQALNKIYLRLGNSEGVAETEAKIEEIQAAQALLAEALPRAEELPFEARCMLALQRHGFRIEVMSQSTDGRLNVEATLDQPLLRSTCVVWCLNQPQPVDEPIVKDLYDSVMARGANKGIMVARGGFTEVARLWAKDKPLELIDGTELDALVVQMGDPSELPALTGLVNASGDRRRRKRSGSSTTLSVERE